MNNCSLTFDDRTFQYSSIESITISGSKVDMGDSAFQYCKRLETVIIGNGNILESKKFSVKKPFRWFVTITLGLMLRSDKPGITSVIHDLALCPGCYGSMIHFFQSSSWSLENLRLRWFSAVKEFSPLYKEGSFHVLVGDGVKQSKEGRRMPGVKKLFQESGNSAKPEYIHGHMFGGLGILAGSTHNWACIPLSIRIHDGLQTAREW